MVTLEQVLDKIADALILDEEGTGAITPEVVRANQQVVRDGIISLGRTNSDRILLYQKDEKANAADLLNTINTGETLQQIVDNFNIFGYSIEEIQVYVINVGDSQNPILKINLYADEALQYEVSDILSDDNLNPINVSQFVSLRQEETVVDIDKALEYLDTNIYELLPDDTSRQDRINNLFTELNSLLPPDLPLFDEDPKDGRVDRLENGEWIGNEDYYLNYSISSTQEDPDNANINEQQAYITRLIENSNDLNANRTIEDIYNIVTPYLTDLLEPAVEISDDREEYENQSNGYLKFRNPNQGIIVRNINQQYIEGLNPETLDFLNTGFTIGMWVKFKDKVSEGTLFNFGNPTREENPFGFRLETYVLPKDGFTNATYDGDDDEGPDYPTWGDYAENVVLEKLYYKNTDTERFVRLIIRDGGMLRDSHVGVIGRSKTSNVPGHSTDPDYDLGLMSATHIPEDFNEWYYIVATFNPNVEEDEYVTSGTDNTGTNPEHSMCLDLNLGAGNECNRTPFFWRNNIDADGYTHQSLQGNKCKVEIISRTKLLRARGFKV
jgi:hypothetical protein